MAKRRLISKFFYGQNVQNLSGFEVEPEIPNVEVNNNQPTKCYRLALLLLYLHSYILQLVLHEKSCLEIVRGFRPLLLVYGVN